MLTSDRSIRKLGRALARRCNGRTIVVTHDRAMAHVIRERGGGVQAIADDPANGRETGDLYHTVIMVDALEHAPEPQRERVLAAAWSLVRSGGKLVVAVPNGDAVTDRLSGGLRRRHLQTLLEPLGRPRLATDQPFRWLVMIIAKPGSNRPAVPHSRLDRYRATARICRGRVMDLGCGEGHLTKLIHDRGLGVAGADLSSKKIRRAREQYPEIAFLRSDIRMLAVSDETFDTVILAEVLEHVPEEPGAEMLAEAWRLVRPGGRLIVSVPNEDCIPHPHHVREFNRRNLRELLRPLGRSRLVTDQPYQWLMMYVEKAT